MGFALHHFSQHNVLQCQVLVLTETITCQYNVLLCTFLKTEAPGEPAESKAISQKTTKKKKKRNDLHPLLSFIFLWEVGEGDLGGHLNWLESCKDPKELKSCPKELSSLL